MAAILKAYLKGDIAHPYGEGEAGLARFIAATKLFYKKVGDRYTLLDVNSITTYLRNLKSEVLTEIVQERAEKKRQKSEQRRWK